MNITWIDLGIIDLTKNWQTLNSPIDTHEVFRITQNSNLVYRGYGWLSFVYDNGGRYGYKKFYMSEEPILILMPVPQALLDRGFLIRYPRLKMSSRTSFALGSNPFWQVKLEVSSP